MKRVIPLFFLLFISISVFAQGQRGMRWGGGVDYDKLHMGFSFHYVASSFKVFKTAEWQGQNDQELVKAINSPLSHGLGVGLLADLKLSEHANLRLNPTVLFAGKDVNFEYANQDLINKDVIATLLEFPLSIKFRSDRRKNYGIYVIGGGKYSRNIASKKRLDDSAEPEVDKQVKLLPGFFSYELGLGVDIYFEYFKMSPEIKWSQSVGNVLDKERVNSFNTPIDKLLLRSIQFSLIFE